MDRAENPELESEIFVDASVKHYPLRDYRNIWSEMNNIVKEYDKLGKRNKKKDDNHLNKRNIKNTSMLSGRCWRP